MNRDVWYDWYRWLPSIDRGMYDKPSKMVRDTIHDFRMAWAQYTLHPTCKLTPGLCDCTCGGQWSVFRGFRGIPLSILQRLNPLFPYSWYTQIYKRVACIMFGHEWYGEGGYMLWCDYCGTSTKIGNW